MDHPDNGIIEYMLTLLRVDDGTSVKDPESTQSADRIHYKRAAGRVRAFIDEIPGGFLIYRADESEEIIYANKALLKIFNCTDINEFKTVTGGTFRGLVHPDDVDRVEAEIESQIARDTDAFDYVEYRIIRKDGIVRWVEDYGHFIRSEDAGDFFYVFITDATEKVTQRIIEKATLINDKKRDEQKLRNLIEEYDKERMLIRQEHLQRLEVIEGLSVNYDSILYADIDKNIVLPYRLSTRLERQFNKKLEVRELLWFLSDYVEVWVHPDDRKYVAEVTSTDFIKRKLKDEPTYYLNYRRIQNGETQFIQLRLVNVGNGENVSQIVMGYRNVDEEVSREMEKKQLLESALNKAKLADVAKNTFLSNMSHDMRTPLNAIFGYLNIAKKNLSNCDATLGYLDKIEAAADQILDLVDKVLEISYAESQDFSLAESPCNINEILRDACNPSARLASQKNITVEVDTSGIEHRNILADRSKLCRILTHIVGNGVKYTNNGGSVKIEASEKKSSAHDLATYTFKISDTGIGIASDVIPRVFDAFERENNSTSSGVFGPGLGLTIAKQLAEIMGGSITAESELGKGSTFTVTLSLRYRSDAPVQIDTDAAEENDLAGKKILLVEDNEINLEIETEILEDLGFKIDSAVNGKAAVEKLSRAKHDDYALVLMDIQMPVMDGRTSAKEIRKLPDKNIANIPIIALSANAFESDRRESIEAGMDAHLTKPIDVPVLLKTIRTTLAARSRQ